MATRTLSAGGAERATQLGDDLKAGVPEGVHQVHQEVRDAGEEMARHPWTMRLARFGYVVRGLLYFLVGILALQVALGAEDLEADHQGAIGTLAAQPLGSALLVAAAVGLAGYAVWGFIRAILDPLGKGSDLKGVGQRFGYFVSAVMHASLCVVAVKYLIGAASEGGAASAESWTAWMLSKPLGAVLVGAAGVWLAGAGVGEAFAAYKKDFCEDMRRQVMRDWEMDLAMWVGRTGMGARAVVFVLTGVLIVLSALTADAHRSRGLDGAIETLAVQPFGPWLLALVAAGLMVFGVYSALCARWMNVGS